MRHLCKGNVAVVKGALLAGCRSFYGYPITPASEIAEAAAVYMPQVGGTFLQAESEVAAINMVYGAASAGLRVMTASSGPGLSLMQEGISYLAGAELPCVVVDVVRGGPGLGNIAPEQSDYFAVVKGGGHGNYRNLVLAPASVQEMADLTMLAFELADRYRNPVVVLADGFIGQMMEPLELKPTEIVAARKALGRLRHARNPQEPDLLHLPRARSTRRSHSPPRRQIQKSQLNVKRATNSIVPTIPKSFSLVTASLPVSCARSSIWPVKDGMRVGLFRPISLWPFPSEALRHAARRAQMVLVVEMSTGQMVEDVRLALDGRVDVEFFGRFGGNVPMAGEVLPAALRAHGHDRRLGCLR